MTILSSLDQEKMKKYIQETGMALASSSNCSKFQGSKGWEDKFTNNAGVYVLFFKNKLVYVGETGSIKARMGDLKDTRNHSFRRSLGEDLFKTHKNFEGASSTKKFPDEIELELTACMEIHLTINTHPLIIGGKEIEEFMVKKFKPKYNNRGKRES